MVARRSARGGGVGHRTLTNRGPTGAAFFDVYGSQTVPSCVAPGVQATDAEKLVTDRQLFGSRSSGPGDGESGVPNFLGMVKLSSSSPGTGAAFAQAEASVWRPRAGEIPGMLRRQDSTSISIP